MTQDTEPPDQGDARPLAFHIRRLRPWYGKRGLTQTELARLASVSVRLLRNLENARKLPAILDRLLSVALALRVPVEALLDPRLVERRRDAIDKRRAATAPRGSSLGEQ